MRKLLLSLLGVTAVLLIEAQTPIADEEFKLGYTPNEKGGTVLFQGKSHSFALDIVGKEVKTTDNPGFFVVDNHIVQTSTVPLPSSKLDLGHLTEVQQKQALSAYVDYEMDYFRKELKLKISDLKKEWVVINSRIFLVWHFNLPAAKENQVSQQIYMSTICFNQVLDLNIAILKGEDFPEQQERLNKLANTLKTSDHTL